MDPVLIIGFVVYSCLLTYSSYLLGQRKGADLCWRRIIVILKASLALENIHLKRILEQEDNAK